MIKNKPVQLGGSYPIVKGVHKGGSVAKGKNMKHAMIDFETTDTKQTTKVLSVGVVLFDIETGELGKELYCKFDLHKGINFSRSEDHGPNGTMKWWSGQDKKIREEAFSGEDNVDDFLKHLLPAFLSGYIKVWGNGVAFDISILDNLYDQIGLKKPYNFWDVMDVRTVVELAAGIVNKPRTGPVGAHHPINDCKHQIRYICDMYAALRMFN